MSNVWTDMCNKMMEDKKRVERLNSKKGFKKNLSMPES